MKISVEVKYFELMVKVKRRGFQEVKVPIFHYNGTGWW